MTIAGYSELTVIGRGASATVYRALQENFGRTVAVKVLHVDVSDRKAQRRFEREKAINGRLSNHPNVVTVLDSGFVDDRYPYLAMEYFEHGSLSQRLTECGPFSVEESLHIGIRIAGALESAHKAGILHRDVKPQNILLSRFGEPALADFGIATILELEQSTTAALTPVHAAPEILELDGGDPQQLGEHALVRRPGKGRRAREQRIDRRAERVHVGARRRLSTPIPTSGQAGPRRHRAKRG